MTKEEKIQQSYGEYWEQLGPLTKGTALSNNGWLHYDDITDYRGTLVDCIDMERDIDHYRPKSLQGIEEYYIFKDVIGFENYQLNKQGVLISKSRISTQKNGKKYTIKEKILKPQIDSTGYVVFGLRNNKKETKKIYLHRILSELFIPNPENKPCVNHKDGVKYNNSLNNLEWCSYKENNAHSFENNLNSPIDSRLKGKTGDKCHNYGKRNKRVYSFNKEYINIREASKDLNLTVGYLYQCLSGCAPNIHNLSYQPIVKQKPPVY